MSTLGERICLKKKHNDPTLRGFTDVPMLISSNEEALGDGLVPDHKESKG